jgi:hypothetical protein
VLFIPLFLTALQFFSHWLRKTHSHTHQELSIIPRAKYYHFALKDYDFHVYKGVF